MKQYILRLNAKLHKIDLERLYEKPIDAALRRAKMGTFEYSSIKMMENREVDFCSVQITSFVESISAETILKIVQDIAMPKGSRLYGEGEDVPCGTMEGYAIYIDSTNLPDEVYKTCKVNTVASSLAERMKGCGTFYSYWEGPAYTALYFYGTSFEKMKQAAQPFVDQYPLCQQCKILQIA